MNKLKTMCRLANGWKLTGIHDCRAFFDALSSLLPANAILVLEEGTIAPDVRAFVLGKAVSPQAELRHGTIAPPSQLHHLPLTSEVLGGLSALSRNHAEPEICDHIYAYDASGMLLQWHDAFCLPLIISDRVAATKVEEFCNILGANAETWKADCRE